MKKIELLQPTKPINSTILKENLYKFTSFAFYHKIKWGAIERRKFLLNQYKEKEIKINEILLVNNV